MPKHHDFTMRKPVYLKILILFRDPFSVLELIQYRYV